MNELGVIMHGDNDPKVVNKPGDKTADLPAIYWNAAASVFAYEFAKYCVQGVEVLGES